MTADQGKPRVLHTIRVEKYRSAEDAADPDVAPYEITEETTETDADGFQVEPE